MDDSSKEKIQDAVDATTTAELALSSSDDKYVMPTKIHWWRSTTTQAVITGLASFLAPGMFSAISSTGAGGLADVNIGNASTAIAYGLIVPSALAATAFMSKFNAKWALAIGAAGYAPYAASFYTNSAFANQWFLIFGGAVCGLTSGIFWATEGTVIMLYSEPGYKGRMLAIWQSIYCSAPLIGGAVNMSFNYTNAKTGGLAPKTYLVFVSLSCIAPLVALLLSNPEKVQRRDGKPVPPFPKEKFWTEVKLTIMELKNPRVIALCLLWSQPLFVPSFVSTTAAKGLTVRSKSLVSLCTPILVIVWFQCFGRVIDHSKLSVRKRCLVLYSVMATISFACLLWLFAITVGWYIDGKISVHDWKTPGFAGVFIPIIFAGASQSVAYGFMYYLATYSLPQDYTGAQTSRVISTLRSAESGSAAISYGINAVGTGLYVTGAINIVFQFVCLFAGAYVLKYIWDQDKMGAYAHLEGKDGAESPEADL